MRMNRGQRAHDQMTPYYIYLRTSTRKKWTTKQGQTEMVTLEIETVAPRRRIVRWWPSDIAGIQPTNSYIQNAPALGRYPRVVSALGLFRCQRCHEEKP